MSPTYGSNLAGFINQHYYGNLTLRCSFLVAAPSDRTTGVDVSTISPDALINYPSLDKPIVGCRNWLQWAGP